MQTVIYFWHIVLFYVTSNHIISDLTLLMTFFFILTSIRSLPMSPPLMITMLLVSNVLYKYNRDELLSHDFFVILNVYVLFGSRLLSSTVKMCLVEYSDNGDSYSPLTTSARLHAWSVSWPTSCEYSNWGSHCWLAHESRLMWKLIKTLLIAFSGNVAYTSQGLLSTGHVDG